MGCVFTAHFRVVNRFVPAHRSAVARRREDTKPWEGLVYSQTLINGSQKNKI